MSETISSQTSWSTGSIALAAAVLVLGMSGVCGSANIAHADDCIAAPNSAAPQGNHWYYHIDRATHRKCWHLRAPGQSSSKTTAQPTSEAASPPVPVNSALAPLASTSAAPSAGTSVSMNAGNDAPPSPHVTMLAIRPQTDAVTGAAAGDGVERPAARGGSDASSMPQAPAPQENTSQAAGPVPTASAAEF